MNNWGSNSISAMVILIVVMLVAITAASVITGETSSTTTDPDIDQMASEIIDQISTNLWIDREMGKYYDIDGVQKIEKIALKISPLVSVDVDITQLSIQINTGESVIILSYCGNSAKWSPHPLFEHPLWSNINGSNFGFLTISDYDNSITDFNTINDYSDNAYVVFKLPIDIALVKGDKITVTLFPSTGITKTTMLKAPMPMASVVSFE